ncbi:AAA family ATPase [Pyxidicoccus xibeiensis]|uniref:AAA family ATPase n=1 Tax=Pyxidicoccus xibeiensis TaxID=2906759 RepID=UPI0020A71736|nr:ATP-binding protein [Pyxidicoccus xibeiensis]MCP3136442.1 AAA family ATPase [Pyxidicoccus xibeiensis]
MLERIFVDNFRCFVNFEWRPGRLALLLGENGSGKSTLGRLLWFVRSLVVNEVEVRQWFSGGSLTRWDQRLEQRIELDVRLPEGIYQYELVVEHDSDEPQRAQVKREALRCAGTSLMTFDEGVLQLHDDDGRAGPAFPAHRSRSGLGAVAASRSNKKLMAFKRWLDEDVWFFKPDPRAMKERTDEGADVLVPDLGNFSSWYPRSIAQDLEVAFRVRDSLAHVFPGFETLGVDKVRPKLQARFKTGKGASYAVDFRELSDGQRALIALYVLRHAILKPGRLVIFDEPDNYVALREIQPWLMEVIDVTLSSDGPQVWFVSHHPELLNRLAPSYGMRLFRHEDGPVRLEPFKGVPGLTPAETIEREWADG